MTKAGFFLLSALAAAPLEAQWVNYPTPGLPRLPDGKPNLSAPAPLTAGGKPDLSGLCRYGLAGVRLPGEPGHLASGGEIDIHRST